MPDTIEYRDESHQYFINNQEYVSVTTVLGPLSDFSRVPKETLLFKRQVGRAVHKAIELGDELDRETLDEQIAGYIASWDKFRVIKPLLILDAERIVYSKKHRYAGRLDLVVQFLDDPKPWLLDVKCTYDMPPVTSLQTAAYANALTENVPAWAGKRAGLQLKPGGEMAELYPYSDRNDFNYFANALSVYRWLKNNGGK